MDYKIGGFCLVRCVVHPHVVDRWYRGKIIDINEPYYIVHLRDHGNDVEVLESALLPSPVELQQVENIPMKVSLFGTQSKHLEFSKETVQEKFKQLIAPFDDCAVSFHIEAPTPTIILWGVQKKIRALATSYSYTNLNIEMVRMGYVAATASLSHVVHTAEIPPDEDAAAKSDPDELVHNSDESFPWLVHFKDELILYNLTTNVADVEQWKDPDRIRKTKFVVFPTYINSNLVIYVLDDYRRHIADAIKFKLTEKVRRRRENVHRNDLRLKPIDEWRADDPCFAPLGSHYYRAKIKRAHMEQNQCSVCAIQVYAVDEICVQCQ